MPDRLRLLTFNVLTIDAASGQERHQVVRRLLPDLRPDVVALQEVTRRPDFDQAAELLAGDLMDALPRVISRPSDPRSA